MQQFWFAGGRVAPARLHAPGLVVPETAAGRDFPVGLLAGQPHFEIVGFTGRKADIATAQNDLAIRQLQCLQNTLGVPGQLLQCLVRLFGAHKLYHFHLFKLVLADHAAGVASITACLAAKTGTVAGKTHAAITQLRIFKDPISGHIGYRYFSGGNQVVTLLSFQPEQVFFKLWQLSCATQ